MPKKPVNLQLEIPSVKAPRKTVAKRKIATSRRRLVVIDFATWEHLTREAIKPAIPRSPTKNT